MATVISLLPAKAIAVVAAVGKLIKWYYNQLSVWNNLKSVLQFLIEGQSIEQHCAVFIA